MSFLVSLSCVLVLFVNITKTFVLIILSIIQFEVILITMIIFCYYHYDIVINYLIINNTI